MTNGQETTMTSVSKRIFGLLAAVLLVVPACTKLEPDSFGDNDIIGFNVVGQSLSSKATFSTSRTFMTRAYRLNAGNWMTNYNDATEEFGPEEVSYTTGGYWTTATKHYWPDSGTLTFFSYSLLGMDSSPAPAISKTGVAISDYSVTDNPSGEILVADIAMDKTKNESYAGFTGVPTHFKHKLAKVQFKLALSDLAEPGTEVELTGLTLSEIYTEGSYTRGGYNDDSWGSLGSLVSDSSPIVLFSGSKQLVTEPELLGSTIMIPQYLNKISDSQHAGITISYTITNPDNSTEDKTVTCYFDEHFMSGVWEKGKVHTYTIRIGVGLFPIKFSGSTGTWTTSDGGDINIGG